MYRKKIFNYGLLKERSIQALKKPDKINFIYSSKHISIIVRILSIKNPKGVSIGETFLAMVAVTIAHHFPLGKSLVILCNKHKVV